MFLNQILKTIFRIFFSRFPQLFGHVQILRHRLRKLCGSYERSFFIVFNDENKLGWEALNHIFRRNIGTNPWAKSWNNFSFMRKIKINLLIVI